MALLQKAAKIKAGRGGRTVANLEEEMHRKQGIELQGCKTSGELVGVARGGADNKYRSQIPFHSVLISDEIWEQDWNWRAPC